MGIYVRLEGMDEPLHRNISQALKGSEFGIIEIKGGIFTQAAVVGTVIAFYSGNDQLCIGAFQIFLHAPAFAVSRM